MLLELLQQSLLPHVLPVSLQVALDVVPAEALNTHSCEDLCGCGGLLTPQLLNSSQKQLVQLRGPHEPVRTSTQQHQHQHE